MKRILITGALGQIGSELTPFLRKRYGNENVVASDIKSIPEGIADQNEPFEHINCLDAQEIYSAVKKYKIDTIFHLAAILSARGEKNPQLAWKVNINGLYNILEIAREYKCAVFNPSSIAAFGPSTPKDNTPQETVQRPNTIYGLTKVTGELLCDYYYFKYKVDTRGVRFPGIISYMTLPGGGTTDYAVDIFYQALKQKKFNCFLDKDTYLDMMYMPVALKAAINLMKSDPFVHLMIRNTKKTADLANYLIERGVLATGLNYPVVPKGDGEMRFQVNADHTDYDIDYTLEVLKDYKDNLKS